MRLVLGRTRSSKVLVDFHFGHEFGKQQMLHLWHMPNHTASIDTFIQAYRPRYEDRLSRLVAIPTISSDPSKRPDIERGAHVAQTYLTDSGFQANIITTDGCPVVFGHLLQDPSYPTVTLYNHLDVQPADPPAWQSDPFTLTIAGDKYTGRGATDDKGPALTALAAIEYAQSSRIPLNFQVIWELEEEVGSPYFEQFMQANLSKLTTDSVIVSDTIWISSEKPAIPFGLRGVMSFELSLTTSVAETHSGVAGGAARNPIGELSAIIAACYDAGTGQVHIPGFYDAVIRPTDNEIDEFLRSGFSVEQFARDLGLTRLRTRDPRAVVTAIMAAPTFEVHGIVGGYTGDGVKMVIPATATAKLSARLVPNQNPAHIAKLIKTFVQKLNPDVSITFEAAAEPYLAPASGPYAAAARTAMQAAFGTEPAFVREGGSIGAVLTMQRYLKVPIMMLGLSLPEQGYHAPNEYFDWHQASGGIKMFTHYFDAIAKIKRAR